MADRPVLDTDVLIDYLRGSGPGAALVRSLRDTLSYRVSAIAAFELALGRSYARNPQPVHALLAVECLPLGRHSLSQARSAASKSSCGAATCCSAALSA